MKNLNNNIELNDVEGLHQCFCCGAKDKKCTTIIFGANKPYGSFMPICIECKYELHDKLRVDVTAERMTDKLEESVFEKLEDDSLIEKLAEQFLSPSGNISSLLMNTFGINETTPDEKAEKEFKEKFGVIFNNYGKIDAIDSSMIKPLGISEEALNSLGKLKRVERSGEESVKVPDIDTSHQPMYIKPFTSKEDINETLSMIGLKLHPDLNLSEDFIRGLNTGKYTLKDLDKYNNITHPMDMYPKTVTYPVDCDCEVCNNDYNLGDLSDESREKLMMEMASVIKRRESSGEDINDVIGIMNEASRNLLSKKLDEEVLEYIEEIKKKPAYKNLKNYIEKEEPKKEDIGTSNKMYQADMMIPTFLVHPSPNTNAIISFKVLKNRKEGK